ncbi:hypothetical protein APSETT444_007061 [Aspergillus pseudonomiae]
MLDPNEPRQALIPVFPKPTPMSFSTFLASNDPVSRTQGASIYRASGIRVNAFSGPVCHIQLHVRVGWDHLDDTEVLLNDDRAEDQLLSQCDYESVDTGPGKTVGWVKGDSMEGKDRAGDY